MTTLHICPLIEVPQVIKTYAPSHVVSLIHLRDGSQLPEEIKQANALHLNFDDIESPQDGCIYPDMAHMAPLVEFLRSWDANEHILIHCWQGISRSVATGLILLAMHAPGRERLQAQRLHGAMPFARPNRRLLALADEYLGRQGEIIAMANCFQPQSHVDIGKHSQIKINVSEGIFEEAS